MLLKNYTGSISLTKIGIWIAVIVASALTTMSQFPVPQSMAWLVTLLQILFIVGIGLGGIGARNALDKIGIDIQSIVPWLKRASQNVTEEKNDAKKTGVVYMTPDHEQKIIDGIGS